MSRPILPLLARGPHIRACVAAPLVLTLAAVLAAAPACTQVRPVAAPSASGDRSALTKASSSPDASATFAPEASSSSSALPTPVDDDGPRKAATAPPVLATPRTPLPPAAATGVGSAAGTPLPTTAPTATPLVPTPQPLLPTIVDAIEGRAELITLLAAVKQAGFVPTLRDRTQVFTVFAPSNQAFSALPQGNLESLLLEENRGRLATILKFHVLPGRIESADLRAKAYPTLDAPVVNVTLEPPAIKVEGSAVQTADIRAGNGVIHIIDSVLLPPDLSPETNSVVALAAADRPEHRYAYPRVAGADEPLGVRVMEDRVWDDFGRFKIVIQRR